MKNHFAIGVISTLLIAVLFSVGVNIQSATQIDALSILEIAPPLPWTHFSTKDNDLESPSSSTEQTASLILDINNDGLNDFLIGSRGEPGPSLVWYRQEQGGWSRFVVDDQVLPIEAGGDFYDIDADGDLDIVMGGDWTSNEVWWWENPYPNFDPLVNWNRHTIKNTGSNMHHDQLFGDFDNDGQTELVFWNQYADNLVLAEIPNDPRNASSWSMREIYNWTSGLEHEGLTKIDIDLDGVEDIVGGGRWFKLNGDGSFTPNIIDNAQSTARVAASQLKEGGWPEVLFVAGDDIGRAKLYEWNGSTWIATDLLCFDVDHGHSFQVGDFNKDGHSDIYLAEMRLNSTNPNAKAWVFLGDGNGNFTTDELSNGYGNHESKLGDLDGDGDLDVLGKPYNWDTPRLDIWLNEGSCELSLDQWERHIIDPDKLNQSIFIIPADLDNDGLVDITTGGWWYKNPGTPSGSWIRNTIGAPLTNVAAISDFDGDGYQDILGTEGVGSESNPNFVWAHNDGSGNFTIFENIEAASGDFL
jgi:hypothetical protein